MLNRKLLVTVLFFILVNICSSQSVFQIVESVPAETKLEESTLPRAADVWVDMMKSAKKSIDIETFYIANEKNEPLEKVIAEIISAANRGVLVRILIDEKFFERYPESAKDFDGVKNITLKKIPFGKIAGGVMHAKYFVVDGLDLFLGSQNFDYRALKHIHEIGVRVKDKSLASMFLRIFETDWSLCDEYSTDKVKELTAITTDIVYTSKNMLSLSDNKYGNIKLFPAFSPNKLINNGFAKEEDELLKFIKNSKNRLFINYYSYSTKGDNKESPYLEIDNEIRKAAARGVDIKIIFSDWAIKKDAIEQIKDLSLLKGIEIKFSSIPEHSSGYIPYSRVQHCKVMIADEEMSWISTANLEKTYFFESRNATLIVENDKVNEELEKVFMSMWNSNYVEKVDVSKEYKPVKRN